MRKWLESKEAYTFFLGEREKRWLTNQNSHMCHPTRQKTCSQPLPQNLKEWDHQHQDLLGVPATTGPGTGTRNTTELHLRSQTWRELARMAGGSCLSFAFANWLKKFWHSPDHRPPTSQARTTRPFAGKFRVRGLFALVMGTLRRQVKITEPHVEYDPAPCFPAHSRRSTLECTASLTHKPEVPHADRWWPRSLSGRPLRQADEDNGSEGARGGEATTLGTPVRQTMSKAVWGNT